MLDNNQKNIDALCEILLLLDTQEEAYSFLKDLCTPTELSALAERWQICQCLHQGLSYRETHAKTGASLTTIGRVGRFMKNEPYQGYAILLKKLAKK